MFTRCKDEKEIVYVKIDSIKPNPNQPRRSFDKFSLEELSKSINEYGVLQPISIRSMGKDSYELVAGERRLRASEMLGIEEIPAIVVNVNDKDSAMIALIENLQRQNLNFFEEAQGYYNLIQDYGLKQEELAEKIGKTQSTIANKIRLLRLSHEIRRLIVENNLTERHARALLKIPDNTIRLDVLYIIIAKGLNVTKTEKLISEKLNEILDDRYENNIKFKRCVKDIRLFTNTIDKAVEMMSQSGVDVKYEVKEDKKSYNISINIPY